MAKVRFGLLLLTFAALMFGQMGSNVLTISASRNTNLEPDEALFAVTVSSSLTTGLDQIVAALQGTGITAGNLVSVNTVVFPSFFTVPNVLGLQWTFELAAPLSNLGSTSGSLAALQQTILQNNSHLTLSFSLAGTQVSPQLRQAHQCPIPDLLADATAQAQRLANAAGLAVGPVVALAQGSGVESPFVGVRPGLVAPAGAFFIATPNFFPALTNPANCSLTVKFSLLRYH